MLHLLRALTPSQRSAVLASYLGRMVHAFDFFVLVFVMDDIAEEFGIRRAPAHRQSDEGTRQIWVRELAMLGHTGAPHARQPMIGEDGNRHVRAAMVEFAWLWLPIAIRASRLSSGEAAKALIFTPVWETSEGIPVSITRRQLLTNAGISLPVARSSPREPWR